MPDPDREGVFHPEFLEDLTWWIDTGRRTARRLLELIHAVLRDPFPGIGKPEPRRSPGPGVWSRRITQEHRCVYLAKASRVEPKSGSWTHPSVP